jgi:myosin VIIa
LLEKSRITGCSKGERNYHIFYAMLAGLTRDEKRKLELEDATKYNYLISGDIIKCENRNDASEFHSIKSAMSVLSFSDGEFWDIMRLLSAILHLGNLKYKATDIRNMDACEITDSVNMMKISTFLGVPGHLLNDALIMKTIYAHGERVTVNLSKEQAIEARDAFTKAIYGQIFEMIVEKINTTIYKNMKSTLSIGILDIFGFENFESNSFEQLCINYANENLQQFFVKYIFKLEQEEYSNEGINWNNIAFVDNQSILDMIGLKPMSIIALLNEETVFPKGSDHTFVAKLHQTHGNKTIYLKHKYEDTFTFGIQHFAGEVYYNSKGFLEKNRDSFNLDLKDLVQKSTNKFLTQLFSFESGFDTMKKPITLSLQFRNSLESLMRTLLACEPSFVRCIKPNDFQRPNVSIESVLLTRIVFYKYQIFL